MLAGTIGLMALEDVIIGELLSIMWKSLLPGSHSSRCFFFKHITVDLPAVEGSDVIYTGCVVHRTSCWVTTPRQRGSWVGNLRSHSESWSKKW